MKATLFKNSASLLAMLGFTMSIALVVRGQPTAVYDLKTDFSDTSNPNGSWSYRAGSTLMHSQMGSPHVPSGQPVWVGPDNYLPVCFKWIGADSYDVRPGNVYFHSANSDGEGSANILWTAMANGSVSMSGATWFGADDGSQFGRSSVWSLWLNGILLTSGEVSWGDTYNFDNPFDFALGSGGAAVLQNISVSAGDQLKLQVRRESGPYGTFVGLNWTIAFTEGPPPTCIDSPSGLVAWWRAEGNALDNVGTHDGAAHNGATFVTGKVRQAFTFDGVDDYISMPHSDDLNPTGPFSVECWINASGTQYSPDGRFLFVDKSHGYTDSTGWVLQGNPDGTVGFGFGRGTDFPYVQTLGTVKDDVWHHVAGVYTGTRLEIYLDGVLQNTFATSDMPVGNTREVEIGRAWGGGSPTRYFHGMIDEVSYYNRALTGSEVRLIQSAGSAGKCCPSGNCPGAVVWNSGVGNNGHTYRYVGAAGIPWGDAKAAAEQTMCACARGHLATISSAEENSFVLSLLPAEAIEAWLGGYQSDPSASSGATWTWLGSESWVYDNWAPGEPNDNSWLTGGEEYLGILGVAGSALHGGNTLPGQWNDQGNAAGTDPFLQQNIAGYIVEYDFPLLDSGNQPPLARCQNITVSAGVNCQADVTAIQVDNGSVDPDNDPVTLTLTPAAPYSLGNTDVTLTVDDGRGGVSSCQAVISVINSAPVITSVTGPTAPVALGSSISVTVAFTDADSGQSHSCTFAWDDGSSDTVSLPAGLGTASKVHTFANPGVYTIAVTVNDPCTGVSRSFEYAVVYDPNGAFVTGGGWIDSPPGAYRSNPSLVGKANFGFVSKYQKGASVPTGVTEFQFKAGDLNFHSDLYQWLVVSGPKAQYKGTGSINGVGTYNFLLTATDGQVNGGGGIDKFRIKITGPNGVVYDNVPGASDDMDAANPQAVSGGSIVIHK